MFRYREQTEVTSAFATLVVAALEESARLSTWHEVRRTMFFVFDHEEYLATFSNALRNSVGKTHNFPAQYEELTWALSESASLLIAISGGMLYVMCSEDADEFDELLTRPKGIKDVLRDFKGVNRRYTDRNLRFVTA